MSLSKGGPTRERACTVRGEANRNKSHKEDRLAEKNKHCHASGKMTQRNEEGKA